MNAQEEKRKTQKGRGLTPAQIRKAVYGKNGDRNVTSDLTTTKKAVKPERMVREPQHSDNGLLLTLPFATTQTASQHRTPDWFTSTQRADVSVIVPLYGTSAKNLVQSWDVDNDGLRVEMIFVDDNCPQNSKDLVVREWENRKQDLKGPIGKIFASVETQGWSACCNIGAERATGTILVFLHPDAIVTEGWLRPLVRLLRNNELGIVGGLQLAEDARTFRDAGGEWSWTSERFLCSGVEVYKSKPISKPFVLDNTPADYLEAGPREKVSSYCMAVRRDLFRFLGGFSPNVQSVTWSDADFCMFVRELGLSIIGQGRSQVIVPVIKEKERQKEVGRVFFRNKWVMSGRLDNLISDKRPRAKQEVGSILIRRRAAHGDVLIAAAVAPALKRKFPNSKIIFSTDCPEVLVNNPFIDKVVEAYSERWFDLYYDLDMVYEYRPDTNILHAFADSVGVLPEHCELFLHSDPPGVALPDSYVVVHAGKTLWAGRNWSTIKFDQISKKLKGAGVPVVCVGTWSDHKTVCCDVDLRDQTTIPQLAHVIKNAKAFVGIDSFPMHVAQTFNVPGACFFGSIRPDTRLIGDSIRPVFAEGLKCLGCHHNKPTPCTATTTCDVGIQDCINNVTTEHMWRVVEELI